MHTRKIAEFLALGEPKFLSWVSRLFEYRRENSSILGRIRPTARGALDVSKELGVPSGLVGQLTDRTRKLR